MATVDALYKVGAGQNLVTLVGTIATDAQFDVQPVAGDQIVYPDGLTVDAQLNVSGPDGAYTLYHVQQTSGTTTNEAYSLSTPDNTAPTLSAPTASATGTSTATGTVDTDEANGTLYCLASTSATESQAAVQGSSVSQAVSSAGTQSVSLTGLTPTTTYYLHFVHVDAAGNVSDRVSSTSITTATAAQSASTSASLINPAGYERVTLSGTITQDGRFAQQPVAGEQILYPTGITVDAQLNISAADGTYTLYHVRSGGVWAFTELVQDSNDTTAPTLSDPSASANGETSLSVSVTTNEGNGTLYAVATGNAGETATYIINNGVQQGVSSTGAQAFTINGLTAGTAYYVHFVHKDAANNQSSVVSTGQVITQGTPTGQQSASTQGNYTAGTGYTMATLEAGFDDYAFQEWGTQPQVGWQLVTWTADGYFDSHGDYWQPDGTEHVHDLWVIDLAGTVTCLTFDNTGLDVATQTPDTTAPTLTLAGDNPLTLTAGSAYVEPGFSATDDRDGNLTGSVNVTGVINPNVPGSYTKTYTVQDAAGNSATQTRTVNVVDTESPVLVLQGDNPLTLVQGNAYSEPGYSANDNVDGDITADVVVTGGVDHLTPATYTVNYVVTDSSGNQSAQTRTVVVEEAPVDMFPDAFLLHSLNEQPFQTMVESNAITVTGVAADTDIPISVNGAPSSQYAVSTDSGDTWGGWTSTSTNVRLNYQVKVRHATSPYGHTSVTTVLNIGGQEASFVSVTRAGDTTAPVIYLVDGDVTVDQGTPYSEPGFAATDNKDGDLTANVVVTGTVDHDTPGLYVLSYTVQDAAGNATTETRLVYVKPDTQPPVITLVPSAAVAVDSVWTEPGYSAVDNKDGDVTADVVVTGTVDTAVPGYYPLTYTVTDADGNTASKTRVVRVGTGSNFGAGSDHSSIAQPIASRT